MKFKKAMVALAVSALMVFGMSTATFAASSPKVSLPQARRLHRSLNARNLQLQQLLQRRQLASLTRQRMLPLSRCWPRLFLQAVLL